MEKISPASLEDIRMARFNDGIGSCGSSPLSFRPDALAPARPGLYKYQ